jgi:hypothetical protein
MTRLRIAGALGVLTVLSAAILLVRPVRAGSGEPDADNRFPNAGAIVVFADPDHPTVPGSGVLIHPRVLLTAGHVTASGEELLRNGVPLFDISAISFGTDAFEPSTWRKAVATLTHPGFETAGHDLGVVILKDPVDLRCATLAPEGLLDDLKRAGQLRYPGVSKKFVAVGYGNTFTFPPPQEQLADGLRRFAFPDFHALQQENWIVLNQNLAAGNTGLAAGDSGGPLFWTGPDGELVLVGVHSGSDPERVAKLVDYRTDTAVALDFIGVVIAMVEAGMFD